MTQTSTLRKRNSIKWALRKKRSYGRPGSVTHFAGFGIKEAAVACGFSIWTRGCWQWQSQQAAGSWVVLEVFLWREDVRDTEQCFRLWSPWRASSRKKLRPE